MNAACCNVVLAAHLLDPPYFYFRWHVGWFNTMLFSASCVINDPFRQPRNKVGRWLSNWPLVMTVWIPASLACLSLSTCTCGP